jgi:predicted DNA binding CopG/RHH family protein
MIKDVDFNKDLTEEEEQWIVDHMDEFEPAPEWVGKSLREAAKNPPIIVKSEKPNKKVITLRLIDKDLKALKAKATEEGLPYQTMITSIIHKYLNGILVDINEARKVIKF